ncbi:peptidase domain-containing ABC transporter [Pedobacter suwonensis]|uniref:peptidase domain-containing ABC transporter n=1 Tax=Pedobacter suwonensis TaxID=332999 RepID=UPI0036B157BF
MKKFPFYKQADQMDCGPTCIRIIAKYYGRNFSLNRLRDISGINKLGVSLLGISEAAEKLGFRTGGIKISIQKLEEIDLPCILHWHGNHFVVLYEIKTSRFSGKTYFIADPATALIKYNETDFISNWVIEDGEVGVALMIEPTPDFYAEKEELGTSIDMRFIFDYFRKFKKLILQLFIGLMIGSLLQLILPFLTQSIVDVGINARNLNFIYIILIAQTMLFLGRLSVDFLRSWILLHISTRINISILTDFLIKLMKLPISFFESKQMGDIMQRMEDQGRIQAFLTGSSLNTIFSMFNLIVFTFILAYYSTTVFFIFLTSSILYSILFLIFLKRRRALDFKRFAISSDNQSNVVQMISGMQEIKLNNCEQQKRWEWESIQARLFKFNTRSLALGQLQQFFSFFINEGKNILITFIVAKSVIDGNLTLGGMMAVQYIVGQLNSPIEQLVTFFQQFQDAKISLERLNEIHVLPNEEPLNRQFLYSLPNRKGIELRDLSFTYPGAGNEPILSNINLNIPEGKTTAIVGMSGSGKTTILKLLLRFYEPQRGDIKIGNTYLNQISFRYWRSLCGVVMQDGFIFSDSISKNIAVGDEYPDKEKLNHAIEMANIKEFIEDLPMGLSTKIGLEGNGISQGQRQRILIARAIYKDPEYILFDEATNSLDSNNEKVIMANLESFFKGRTVIIVAHRLSTVKNADNIVVLDKGSIIEQGTPNDLMKIKGKYYQLVKNQVELEN